MRFYIVGVFLFFSAFLSCSSDEISSYTVGSDFLENEINIRQIDTLNLRTGTYKLDSIITSNTGRVLLGHINDDNLGTMKSSSFFQVTPSTYDIDNDTEYDSISLVLNFDDYYQGDTLNNVQTYKVYKITEPVTPEDGSSFYNTSYVNIDYTNTLGEVSFTPRPNLARTIYITLDDTVGEDIFNKIKDSDIKEVDDDSEFLSELRGLAIIPETSNKNLMLSFGLDPTANNIDNTSLRIYYTQNDEEGDTSEYIDFPVADLTKQFNTLEVPTGDGTTHESSLDLSNSDISDLEGENGRFISYEGEVGISQGFSGICARIEIPGLNNLKQVSEFGSVLSAELTFSPVVGTYGIENPLQSEIPIYIVNDNNEIQSLFLDSVTFDTTLFASLSDENDEFDQDVTYTIDLTNYVNLILNSEEVDLDYALMLRFSDYNTTTRSIVINGSEHGENSPKLTLKYLNY